MSPALLIDARRCAKLDARHASQQTAARAAAACEPIRSDFAFRGEDADDRATALQPLTSPIRAYPTRVAFDSFPGLEGETEVRQK